MKKFYCQNCEVEVPLEAEFCSNCGKEFGSVLCPKCGYSGKSQLFINGCPNCEYKAVETETEMKRERPLTLKRFISIFLILASIIGILLLQF